MGWLVSEPLTPANGAPNTAMPAATVVAAGGMFFSTMAAALVSASASATAVAPVASLAFDNLGLDGLQTAGIFKKDWHSFSLKASKESSAIVDRFYEDLEREQQELDYVLHIASHVSNEIRNRGQGEDKVRWLNKLWIGIWGDGLGHQKRVGQRALGFLLDLVNRVRSTRPPLQKELIDMKLSLERLVGEKTKLLNPGRFFQKGVKNLNEGFDFNSAGWVLPNTHQKQGDDDGKAPVAPASQEQAAFVVDLHTTNGAGSMLYEAFQQARTKLNKLFGMVEREKAWIIETEDRLGDINRRLSSDDDNMTVTELQRAVDDIVSLAEEWYRVNQERFYESDEDES